ncbi:hypothetical protein TSUD_03320 [Trifolium subterraneum]|nr:hypothetical protein TSUD_03320 [Trifolium subterraneum]
MEIGQIRGSQICLHHRHGHGNVRRNFGISISKAPAPMLSTKSENRMFILGMGFVGQTLASKLQNQGCVSILQLLRNYTHFLVCVPPTVGIGDPMLQHEELIRSYLVNGDLRWLCYLSSTSVYGDCDGELVDEDYPTNPENELAKLRLTSEQGWSNFAHHLGFSPLIFRLGGIYGPGRRVVYNIVDDDPAPREEVFEYARNLVERKWPDFNLQPLEQKEWSIVKTRNGRGEKRVSNARIKKELGVQLLYPDYKSGLQSIIDQIESPFQFS